MSCEAVVTAGHAYGPAARRRGGVTVRNIRKGSVKAAVQAVLLGWSGLTKPRRDDYRTFTLAVPRCSDRVCCVSTRCLAELPPQAPWPRFSIPSAGAQLPRAAVWLRP